MRLLVAPLGQSAGAGVAEHEHLHSRLTLGRRGQHRMTPRPWFCLAGVIRCSCLAGRIAAAVIGVPLGVYPGRAGGPWLCRTLVLSSVPSAHGTRRSLSW